MCDVGNTRRDGIFVVDSQTKEVIHPFEVRRMFEMDFSEQHHYVKEFSQEDRKFLEIHRKKLQESVNGNVAGTC